MHAQALIEKKVAAAAPPYAILTITAPLVSIDALGRILRDIPAGFRLPIVVALLGESRPGESVNDLPARLQPHTSLAVQWVGHRVSLRAGTVSLAMPGESIIVGSDGMAQRLQVAATGPSRSAKVLLDSIAASHGERALGLVLGGTHREEASGLRSMKTHGATLVAHDEAAARLWGSAREAVDSGGIDLVLPLERIASTIVQITAAVRRPKITGPQRCVPAPLFSREPGLPHEVTAVQRAMHRVLDALEQMYPVEAGDDAATVDTPELATEIANDLRPIVADAGRSLLVDCAASIASFAVDHELVRELARHLVANVLAASAGSVEVHIAPLRLFLQIVASGEAPRTMATDAAHHDLRALHALVKPLRGHVVATKRKGRVEYAVWLPREGRALRPSSGSRSRDPSSRGDRGTR